MRIFIALLLGFHCSFAQNYTIYTENNPPWNYEKDGAIQGISVEVFKLLQNEVGNSDPIDLVPWNRGYHETLNKPNHILFLTARIDQRENLFQWVGPIVVDKVYLYEYKNNPQNVQTLEEAKNVVSIDAGTSTNAAFQILKGQGFTNLSHYSQDIADIKLLKNKRVSLVALGEYAMKSKASFDGIDINDFVQTPVLVYSYPLYIAFSRQSDKNEVAKWQKAFEKIEKEGLITQIIETEFAKMGQSYD